MALIGSTIKPFTAQAYKEGKFVEVTDADVKGKWAVFFFYPADFTFVCPTELEDLADIYPQLQKMGVEVYSVSTDTHFSHKAWHDTSPAIGKINYYMLGDQNHILSTNFDVLREGQGLADRGTFVVDPEGVIQLVEITSEVNSWPSGMPAKRTWTSVPVRTMANDGVRGSAPWATVTLPSDTSAISFSSSPSSRDFGLSSSEATNSTGSG